MRSGMPPGWFLRATDRIGGRGEKGPAADGSDRAPRWLVVLVFGVLVTFVLWFVWVLVASALDAWSHWQF